LSDRESIIAERAIDGFRKNMKNENYDLARQNLEILEILLHKSKFYLSAKKAYDDLENEE